ncbi:ISAs1 family transposase [Escherichia coli]|nr:ISAs1 family transposase [Escherichia coli]
MELKKLMEHISITPDYRQAWKVEHKLSDILLLTICAVISGAEGWEDIEDFGETHIDFLKQYGDFENGMPVHDTIARVVSCISPAKFHECFINWMRKAWSATTGDSEDDILLSLFSKDNVEGGKARMQPIRWDDYAVRVMNGGRMVQLYNKSKPIYSPLTYRFTDESGEERMGYYAPVFSLIDGQFIPVT